jgi:Dockerin type I domain
MTSTNIARHWNLGLAALLAVIVLAFASSNAAAANDHGVDSKATLYVSSASCAVMAADINGDCQVSGFDLFLLLGAMGNRAASGEPTGPGTAFPWDINGDGGVSGLDLFLLIGSYGQTSV